MGSQNHNGVKKTVRYKMYKSKKNWMVAGIALFSFGLATFQAPTAHADTTNVKTVAVSSSAPTSSAASSTPASSSVAASDAKAATASSAASSASVTKTSESTVKTTSSAASSSASSESSAAAKQTVASSAAKSSSSAATPTSSAASKSTSKTTQSSAAKTSTVTASSSSAASKSAAADEVYDGQGYWDGYNNSGNMASHYSDSDFDQYNSDYNRGVKDSSVGPANLGGNPHVDGKGVIDDGTFNNYQIIDNTGNGKPSLSLSNSNTSKQQNQETLNTIKDNAGKSVYVTNWGNPLVGNVYGTIKKQKPLIVSGGVIHISSDGRVLNAPADLDLSSILPYIRTINGYTLNETIAQLTSNSYYIGKDGQKHVVGFTYDPKTQKLTLSIAQMQAWFDAQGRSLYYYSPIGINIVDPANGVNTVESFNALYAFEYDQPVVLNVTGTQTITEGTKWTNDEGYVSGTDEHGDNLSYSQLTSVTGDVDYNTPGTYHVTYSYTDDANNFTSKVVEVIVTAADESVTVNYVDQDGNVLKSTTLTGKDGETVDIPSQSFDGYDLKDGQPTTYTYNKDANQTVTVSYIQKASVVVNYVDQDGNVLGTKTINGHVNDQVSIPDETFAGYTKEANQPNSYTLTKDANQTVTVKYDKNAEPDHDASVVVNYVDEDGNVLGTETIKGHVGDKVNIPGKSFTGYTLDADQPTSYTLTDAANQTVTVKYSKKATEPTNPDPDITVTIHYVDHDGNVLATRTVTGKAGEQIQIPSVTIDGYTLDPDQATTYTITDADNQVVTVSYSKNEDGSTTTPGNNGDNNTDNSGDNSTDNGNHQTGSDNNTSKDDNQTNTNPSDHNNNGGVTDVATGSVTGNGSQTVITTPTVSNKKADANTTTTLPQTGEAENHAQSFGLVAAALSILGLFGLGVDRKRKND
ncbi:MucBP domain-containing protein [Levilactobacillus bambusae]|uniref:Gram-positive cocci surface proteins LPxTG domain-containing protein n=1 Tax=Levilactobacillus bambusae TaxID=2024736 RepID=A0A2V1MZY8_9LACO|nr:MucBP domain-containing protein [Levilactobacillus bambusae]PWG00333.1 hypothetical protein DCM90_05225 [Levilactobacillus bambusae]